MNGLETKTNEEVAAMLADVVASLATLEALEATEPTYKNVAAYASVNATKLDLMRHRRVLDREMEMRGF